MTSSKTSNNKGDHSTEGEVAFLSFILSLPNAATVIRTQIAVGILSSQTKTQKAHFWLSLPKHYPLRVRERVLLIY